MRFFSLCLLAALGAAGGGCGHPATPQECEKIIERVAELELKAAHVEPGDVGPRVKETKEAFRRRMMNECVGRRITDRAFECVKNAKTSEEISEDCFD
jgi:hypothetical protein